MSTRDEQIVALRARNFHLHEPEGRLEECYAQIREAYERNSIVGTVGRVEPAAPGDASDYRVLTNSEARPLRQFTADSVYWDMYCQELGRSVASGERRHVFETLSLLEKGTATIDVEAPSFGDVITAIRAVEGRGYDPDLLCAPTGLMVPMSSDDSALSFEWNNDGETYLVLPDRKLRVLWSNRGAPLDRFVVLDSRHATWWYKPDPETGGRLRVAIGEPEQPPRAVAFIAETVARYEFSDSEAFEVVALSGDPLDPMEYVNRNLY